MTVRTAAQAAGMVRSDQSLPIGPAPPAGADVIRITLRLRSFAARRTAFGRVPANLPAPAEIGAWRTSGAAAGIAPGPASQPALAGRPRCVSISL
jgi:hypothetical protein